MSNLTEVNNTVAPLARPRLRFSILMPLVVLGVAGCFAALVVWVQSGAELVTSSGNLASHSFAAAFLLTGTALTCLCLWRSGLRAVAAMAAGAMVFGPLSVTAAPLSASMFDASDSAPVLWWSLTVGVCELALCAAVAAVLSHVVGGESVAAERWAPLGFVAAFAGIAGLFMIAPGLVDDPGHETLPTRMVLGWAGLAAGVFVAMAVSRRWSARLSLLAFPVTVVAAMYVSYSREGGWPHVPGWENGAQSPLFASLGTAALFIVAPAVGLLVSAVSSRSVRICHEVK